MRVNQKTLARNLGVTQVTVSKALSGGKDISEKVRSRVEAEARRLGYSTNKLARSLVGGKSDLVGLFLPNFSSPYFLALFDAIEDALGRNGRQILTKRWDKRTCSDADDLNVLLHYNVDGLIVTPRQNVPWEKSVYPGLLESGMKIVSVSALPDLAGVSSVASNDVAGAAAAIHYLQSKGHRSIAYFGKGSPGVQSERDRLKGYRDGVGGKGVSLCDTPTVSLVERLREFMARHPGVTSFFCVGDESALSLINAIGSLGLSVPDDISVMGYGDNLFHPEEMKVPLTTMSQHSSLIGVKAVELLMRLLDGSEAERVEVEATLVERGSVRDINR